MALMEKDIDIREWPQSSGSLSQPVELLTQGNGHEARFKGEYVAI